MAIFSLLTALIVLLCAGYYAYVYTLKDFHGVAPIDTALSDLFLVGISLVAVILGGAFIARLGHDYFGMGSNLAVFASTIVWHLLIIAIFFVFQRFCSSRFMVNFLPSRRSFRIGAAYFAIALLVVYSAGYVISFSLKIATGEYPSGQGVVRIFSSIEDLPTKILAVLSIIIVAPIAEELLFRGLVYRVVKGEFSPFKKEPDNGAEAQSVTFSEPNHVKTVAAAIITSLLFAGMHGFDVAFVPLFAMGMVLTAAYEKSGRIFTPILAHSLFNAATIAMIEYGPDIFIK